ncbi:hypothetical protein ABK040_002681 [Willaertia magna]
MFSMTRKSPYSCFTRAVSPTSLNSSQTSNLDRSTQSLIQQPISQTQNTVSSSGAQDITLAQGEANAYLQFGNPNSSSSTLQGFVFNNNGHNQDSSTVGNASNPFARTNSNINTNDNSNIQQVLINRPLSTNHNLNANTGFQFSINNQNSAGQQSNNAGNLFNLFRGNNNSQNTNPVPHNNDNTKDEINLSKVVAEDCLNMALELVAYGFNKEDVESMNAFDLFFHYGKMHSQLDSVYNNEAAFQKRIESLLTKYYSYMNNPDELSLFTMDNCQKITSDIIKFDFQIYNYLGRLGVCLNNSSDLVERQELQELMILLIALRRLSLKFGAENNNMNMSSELIVSYLKSDTLESTLSKKLSKLSKKHKEGKMLETISNIGKNRAANISYNNKNQQNKGISKNNNKFQKQKQESNNKGSKGSYKQGKPQTNKANNNNNEEQ